MANSGASGGRVFARHSETRGVFRGLIRKVSRGGFEGLAGWLSACPSGHVACSEGKTEESVSKACRKGFRGDGFRDRWHSPKDGPAGFSVEASKGAFGRASERLRKGGGVFRGHASDSGGAPEGLRGWLVRKGVSGGSFEGWSSKGSTAGGSGRWILDLRLRLVG